MINFKGKIAHKGFAIGPLFLIIKKEIKISENLIPKEDVGKEIQRFLDALTEVEKILSQLTTNIIQDKNSQARAVFQAFKVVLHDPKLISNTKKLIQENYRTADFAVNCVLDQYITTIENLSDPYLRQRATDIKDIKHMILEILTGQKASFFNLDKPSILVARDVVATDLARINRTNILGIVLEKGTMTSHVTIVSRSLDIPLLISCEKCLSELKNDMIGAIDSDTESFIIEPDNKTLTKLRDKLTTMKITKEILIRECKGEAITKDGIKITIGANIANIEDAYEALRLGADGVGLFRTELLFTRFPSLPNETTLIEIFTSISNILEDHDIIIRTLDAGSDKPVPSIPMENEENPALGVRGLRLTLEYPILLETLFSAILRANIHKNLSIMYPMVCTLDEVLKANQILSKVAKSLETTTNTEKSFKIPPVGIMVETPSSAIMSDQLARYVDFFSLGTNDLTQYVMAADRTNPRVIHLLDHFQPAVLHLIKTVAENAHKYNKWVGVCGEMAGNPDSIPLLIGLGIDELSMNPNSIPLAKFLIKNLDYTQLKDWAIELLDTNDSVEIRKKSHILVEKCLSKINLHNVL